jgi:hypothetical protein
MQIPIGAAIVILAVGLSGPAMAKKARHYYPPDQWSEQSGFANGAGFANGFGVCRPMCVADVTPCDPPEFKNADGRCNSGAAGGRL